MANFAAQKFISTVRQFLNILLDILILVAFQISANSLSITIIICLYLFPGLKKCLGGQKYIF